MAIGWDDLGDLRKYPDHDTVAKKLIEVYQLKGYPINDSRACFNFLHVMHPGDRVIVKRGHDEVVGYGIITGEYEYRPERPTYQNVRRVRWERRGNWKCKPVFASKTLTDFTSYTDTVQYLTDLIGVSEAPSAIPAAPTLPRTRLMTPSKEWLLTILSLKPFWNSGEQRRTLSSRARQAWARPSWPAGWRMR